MEITKDEVLYLIKALSMQDISYKDRLILINILSTYPTTEKNAIRYEGCRGYARQAF